MLRGSDRSFYPYLPIKILSCGSFPMPYSQFTTIGKLKAVWRILARQVSLFSGEDFTMEEAVGLNGICDFLLTRSTQSPVI